jgi:hypothetical protein
MMTSPALSFASFGSEESLATLMQDGQDEYKVMETVCDQNWRSASCAWARSRVQDLTDRITSHPHFPQNYRPTPLRQCLYASMVACSILGGPNPADQGLEPWSSFSGQELEAPVESFRKEASEAGDGPFGRRNKRGG